MHGGSLCDAEPWTRVTASVRAPRNQRVTCIHAPPRPPPPRQVAGDYLFRVFPLPAEVARLAGSLRELALHNHTCGQEELAVLSAVRQPEVLP